MNDNIIGSQIMRFRKAAGITQEELGKAVGVSTQAVSRWECGGAPDVTLLPAIADRLGVAIDALFGREGGETVDVQDIVNRWIMAQPIENRIDALCRLMWNSAKNAHKICNEIEDLKYLETCRMVHSTDHREDLLRTAIALDHGLLLGVGAEDMSFMSVFPKPEAGYAAFFADSEDYRRLFSTLAMPNALEILYYLYSEKERFYSPGALARQLGLELPEVESLLAALLEVNLLRREEMELESGLVNVYIVCDEMKVLIPFLYFARWLGEVGNCYHVAWGELTKPILRKPSAPEEK